MFERSRSAAVRRERDGPVSHILLHEGGSSCARMTVTWVDVAPGSRQRAHSHVPERVYVVGRGKMRVGDEERWVEAGDLIFIPPEAVHGIENSSDEVLTYISAATPAIDWETFYDTGPLRAEDRLEESVSTDER